MIGMVILPIGLYLGLVHDQIRTEVKLLALGGAFFVAGWLIAKREEE